MKETLFILLLIIYTLSPIGARAATPSADPILRIHTDMHAATIKRIGIDAQERYVVSASLDKTARVWDLATGNLLRTLRPPLGSGNEGKLYSVAISPDGQTVACGGWGQYHANDIYLFDRSTGHMILCISGMPNVILHLAFSPDGQYLAATLGQTNGVRVFRTADGKPVGRDSDYGSNSYCVAFDAAGHLATVCYDGFVRLYAPLYGSGLKLLAKKAAQGGKRPISVAFSPDDQRLAVGFQDSTKVDVLSALDLTHLYFPDNSGISKGNLNSVAWSADGSRLYAGGTYNRNGMCPIVAWSDEGRGPRQQYDGPHNTLIHLLSLTEGGLVYGAADPALGRLDAQGHIQWKRTSAIADYRAVYQNYKLSADGRTVWFGYEYGGKSPARFSAAERRLLPDTGSSADFKAPDTTSLNITGWKDTRSPKLNGKLLKLEKHESSRSLAIVPDKSGFALGTEWGLRYFDKTGQQLWNQPAQGVVWGINISADGKLIVAAFGDGTIRWYRIGDGEELLALFPHNDQKRWVMWTPTGYYDAAPGAENLIGWHLNRGRDQAADFFGASKFRQCFYRPDVVAQVLETGDEDKALRLADAAANRKRQETDLKQLLPPVVTLHAPADGTRFSATDLSVRYSVRSPSGEPVTAVRVLIDGRPAAQQRGIVIAPKDTQQIQVTLPQKDCELSLIAENRYTSSETATVRLVWDGDREAMFKPKLYVLAIGVSQYQNPALTLGYAAKDARDLAQTLEKQKNGLYREVVVKLLTDDHATKGDILDGLDWIQKETTSRDVAVIFLAGHGVNDSQGTYYFLPADADPDRLKRTGLVFFDVKSTVSAIAGKVVAFVDTCHSGNVLGATRRGTVDVNAVVNELSSAENGAVVFTAATGRQYSLERPEWNNGAFTKALVEGLQGKASLFKDKNKITVNLLDYYICERVKELTGGQQTPATAKPATVPDFPIALKP